MNRSGMFAQHLPLGDSICPDICSDTWRIRTDTLNCAKSFRYTLSNDSSANLNPRSILAVAIAGCLQTRCAFAPRHEIWALLHYTRDEKICF